MQIDRGETGIIQRIRAQYEPWRRDFLRVRRCGCALTYRDVASLQRDAASIIADEGVCLQTPVENDPLSLDGQSAGISTRDYAFLTDAVSSADINEASGSRNYPLILILILILSLTLAEKVPALVL